MAMGAIRLFEDERVESRFVKIVNGITRGNFGPQMFIREKEWFIRLISESDTLRQCSPISIFSAFMDVATLGLSVAQGSDPLAYLVPYNVTVGGTPARPEKQWRVKLEVSPYGELAMRKYFRQVQDVDNPVIVYEDDDFDEGYRGGIRYVDYKKNHQSKNRRIKAGFIRIVKPGGTVDFFVMDMAQVERLKNYSKKKNGGNANKLYSANDGQIDEGFFKAKIIKHAFKGYPKAPYMQHIATAVFQTEQEDDTPVDISENFDLVDDSPSTTTTTHPVEEGDATDVTEENSY